MALLAILLAMALIPGCGGGSSTSIITQPPGTEITVNFAGPAPLAVAEQIGTGAWASVAVPSNGQLTITVPGGTANYALAYVCAPGANIGLPGNEEFVFEAAISDGTSYSRGCPSSIPTGSATGSADGSAIPGATGLYIYGGPFVGQPLGAVSGPFAVTLIAGTDDVAVVAQDALHNVLGVKIVRGQTVPGVIDNGSTITLASADVTTSQPITVTNIPTGFMTPPLVVAQYRTANGTFFALGPFSATQYATVPSTEAQSGDSYFFSALASNLAAATGQLVSVSTTATSPGPITLQLPAPLPFVPPTAGPFPAFTLNYSGFSGSAVGDFVHTSWLTNSVFYVIDVSATSAYLNGATTVALPNLTSLAGFLSPANSGTLVDWSTSVSSGPPSNGTAAIVTNIGQYTEP